MFYKAELNYLEKVLKKLHLQVLIIKAGDGPDYRIDMGLRKMLGLEQDYARAFSETTMWAKPKTIYKLSDAFLCNYIFFTLPGVEGTTSFVLGPYMAFEMSHNQIMEEAEQYNVPASDFKQLENFYASLPVVKDELYIFTLLNVFAETIWNGEPYDVVDIKRELKDPQTHIRAVRDNENEDTLLNMQIMENRYAYENELIQNVSKGLMHRADMMLSGFTQVNFEQRMSDPLRNAKNYCVICNTLLRKAAEKGGVHPIYLDRTSSVMALKIESLSTVSGVGELMREMVRAYCRLVRQQSLKNYSSPVRKAVMYINENLSGELGLNILAQKLNLSAGYLSDLFKKDTGTTITEYITDKRMDFARYLLSTTHLQIQTVAQHCGISDVNYFSKVFKKYTGLTPKEYRSSPVSELFGE